MTVYRKAFFAICIALLMHTAEAQTVAWAKQFTSATRNEGVEMATDAAGNVIIAGYFSGTADMDPGPGVYNLNQPTGGGMYIVKLGGAGNMIWAKQFVSGHILCHALALDAAGNIYTTGFFQRTTDFDPGPGVYNLSLNNSWGADIFISKLDNNGNFVWAKQIIGNYYPDVSDIQIDPSGNVLVGGQFNGTVDFDPGPAVRNMQAVDQDDAFIVKLDNTGNYLWAKQFSGLSYQAVKGLSTDAAGNIYSTGFFNKITDFDPGPGVYNVTTLASATPFISKLDANGGFIWAKQVVITGSYFNAGQAIVADATGNVYITGNFQNPADFDPGPGVFSLTPASQDIFLMKLDATGNFSWAGKVGGAGFEGSVVNLTRDGNGIGNLMLTGMFQETADFDPGPNTFNLTSAGEDDIYIARYTDNGNLITAWRAGSAKQDIGRCAFADATGNIYATGWFYQTVDFDPGPAVANLTAGSNNFNNTYIVKYARCANATSANLTALACNSYTYNGHVYTSSGTYTQLLQNAAGCDSVVTLQLTIGGSVSTANATACDSYLWEGQSYTTSGLYIRQYTDASGCDSIRRLNLTINDRVSTSLSATICEGETFAGYATSGTYINTYTAANGCDSVRTLVLTVKAKRRTTVQATVCQGQAYLGYTIAGTYTNTYPSSNGCDSIRTLILTVNPQRQTLIDTTICEGESYYAAGAAQTTAGEYTDSLHTYLGCDSVIITRLRLRTKPQPNLGPDRSLCAGSVATFNPGVFDAYRWQDGSSVPSFTAGAAGIYWVRVTRNRCMATDTILITAINPVPAHFLPQPDSICSYDKKVLQSSRSYNSYLWSNGSVQSSITVNVPGRYILKVTDANNCTGQDTTQIYSKECLSGVYVPTAFSPNTDGKNDVFKALVHGITLRFSLQVYNRLGQVVFETTDPTSAWDGTHAGNPCAPAAYVWICRYQLVGGTPQLQKGTVLLIR
jgi:gliding motility-associated-like protein